MKNILSKILPFGVMFLFISIAYADETQAVKPFNTNSQINQSAFMTIQDITNNGLSGVSMSNTSGTTYKVALYIGNADASSTVCNAAMLDSWDGAVGVEIPANGGITIQGHGSFNLGSNYLYNMVMNMLYQFNHVRGEATPADLTNYTPGKTADQSDDPGHWCIRIGLFANSVDPSNGLYPVGVTYGITSSGAGQNNTLITAPLNAPAISITCVDSSLTCTADTPTVETFPNFDPPSS